MNFINLLLFVAFILAISLGQSEANIFQKIKEGGENTFHYIKNAALEVIEVGQKAADVAATARGQK